jgi:hypothetical protein
MFTSFRTTALRSIHRLSSSRPLYTASCSHSPRVVSPPRKMPTSKLSIESVLSIANSKHQIPQIGFGVYLSPPEKCVNSCRKALEAGYRHIDTAQYYDNESSVGQALRESKIAREEVYITTKILSAGKDADSTYSKVLESVEKLVGNDGYIDLFLIHTPNGGADARKLMWQALEKAKQEGKVREIGVSNYGIQHIEEIKSIGKVFPPAINQIEVRVIPFSPQQRILIICSSIPGANSANVSNTARRTTSLSKPTAPSSATKRQMTRLSSAYARSTTWGPIRFWFAGACRRDTCRCPRATHRRELSATRMYTASSSTRMTWQSWTDWTRARTARLCRLLPTSKLHATKCQNLVLVKSQVRFPRSFVRRTMAEKTIVTWY